MTFGLLIILSLHINAENVNDIIIREAKTHYEKVYDSIPNVITETLMYDNNVFIVNFIDPKSKYKDNGFVIVGYLKGATTILGYSNMGYLGKNNKSLKELLEKYQQLIGKILL